ncbi:RNase adapter RapZ [Dinoroseobacter sp. S76]|uniref:RNase adapter RapZ n=1 Tax=Dinoroseobacter sp. S76 TaxID=3415124 RepID=UPI003C799C3C
MQDAAPSPTDPPQKIVLVTGPSGAGRTTAIHGLEDLGFEAIDNLPLSLVPRLLDGPPLRRPLALGLDVRTRDFSLPAIADLLSTLEADPRADAQLLYLDASAPVLARRFSETRRRHPMAPAESPSEGIEREADLLAPIRARADILIDTSDMSPHDLRADMLRWFGNRDSLRLAVSVRSFSYKRGTPQSTDMVFDVRFLQNPYWCEDLRKLDGRSKAVAAYVASDPRFDAFFDNVLSLTRLLLPAYRAEGKSHLAIGFGCTGGQHRSVTVTEKLAAALVEDGWQVSIRHLGLEQRHATRRG